MISQNDLAALLVDHYGVAPGETEAQLLAGLILDDHERGRTNRTLRESVEAARAGFPGFFPVTPKPQASMSSRSTAPDGRYNPWSEASKNVTMQVKIMAENPALAAELRAAAK